MLWPRALNALAATMQADQRTYPRGLAQPPRLTTRRESPTSTRAPSVAKPCIACGCRRAFCLIMAMCRSESA